MAKEFYWAWSGSEVFRNGPHKSKEEAIEEALLEFRNDDSMSSYIEVGILKKYVPNMALGIVDMLAEQAYGEVGEAAEDWLSSSSVNEEELEEMLDEVLQKWLKKNNLIPSFGTMEGIEEINLEEVKK